MRHIGIDPGQTGAICWIDPNGEIGYEDLAGSHFDAINALKRAMGDEEKFNVTLEGVGPRGTDGRASMWKFAEHYGVLLGAIICHALPFTPVAPSAWKKRFGLDGKDKGASRDLARQLYPAAGAWLTRVKDHGRAEALLLAHYGRNGGVR